MLGTGMVVLDAAAANLFGKEPSDIGFIKIAGEMGAGEADFGALAGCARLFSDRLRMSELAPITAHKQGRGIDESAGHI